MSKVYNIPSDEVSAFCMQLSPLAQRHSVYDLTKQTLTVPDQYVEEADAIAGGGAAPQSAGTTTDHSMTEVPNGKRGRRLRPR